MSILKMWPEVIFSSFKMPFSVMKSSLWVNVKAKQIPSAFFIFLTLDKLKLSVTITLLTLGKSCISLYGETVRFASLIWHYHLI